MTRAGPALSAGVAVVRRGSRGGWSYLLLRAYDYWDFPKGLVEEGEDPLAAAIREVEEETTLTDLEFKWGPVYRETPEYGRNRKVARYYLAESPAGEVSLPVSPELGFPEHDEYRWLEYREACKLLNERLQPIIAWARDAIGDDSGR